MLDRTTGRVLRRFHLGARHAADVLGVAATEVTEQIKQSIHMSDASVSSESIEFRLVRPLVKGIEVKTPYGIGTILRLKGFEGVAGFSLVVQLDSWVLAGGQKPMLYCDADEVIAVNESYGSLESNNCRILHKSMQRTTMTETFFGGDDNFLEDDEGRGQDEKDRSARPKRACRSIQNDREGNLIIKEFHVALHYYLQTNDESPICRWQNDGCEFLIYKEDILSSNVRTLMGIHGTIREKKRLKQWLLKEMFDNGFIRTRYVFVILVCTFYILCYGAS